MNDHVNGLVSFENNTVGKLQTVLHEKAKANPEYRFYSLYDKICRKDVLAEAYERCRSNKGAAGVDKVTFEKIEEYGRSRWLDELAEKLKNGTYRCEAVMRVWIPKDDNKKRPLGIPVILDRVVQMAFVLIAGPIFEADLQPEQHAYRAGHSAHEALREVQDWLSQGYMEVVDADLSGYFDSIPHHDLMKSVARRISDGRVLHLVKMWLEAAVEETDEKGKVSRTTRNKDEGRGTPQGGVASPLLSNLYMRRFLLAWKKRKSKTCQESHIVNYADDFVICCRTGRADDAMKVMRSMMKSLRLTVNEKKTRKCVLPKEEFTFLGFTFCRQVSWRTGVPYVGAKPSKKKVLTICRKISEETSRGTTYRSREDEVKRLNQILRGWSDYYSLGSVWKARKVVQQHACRRLRQWLRVKHKRRAGYRGPPDLVLHEEYGLMKLSNVKRKRLWANS